MGEPNKNERRAQRAARKRRGLKAQASPDRRILELAEECPDLVEFTASIDTSGFRRLLGIFPCSLAEYLATEMVLEKHGHPGYRPVQAETDGDPSTGGDRKARGWTTAVKRGGEPDEAFRIFVGIVRHPATGRVAEDICARWSEVIALAHELGHAHDMDHGGSFHIGGPLSIEQAEYEAHGFACRLLRRQRLTMGLAMYLSIAVCPIATDEQTSAAVAARRFMASLEYRRCRRQIPRFVREQFGILPPH
jgi:hypothetical protein